MTKPSRTDSTDTPSADTTAPACPPIRGPQKRALSASALRKNYIVPLVAYHLATGKTVVQTATELSLHPDGVRAFYTDPEVIALADERSTAMKELFAQRSEEFIAKIISSMESQYDLLKDEMVPCIEALIAMRDDCTNTGDYIHPSSTRIAAIKELKGWFEAIAKAIMSTKGEQAGVVFAVPMKDLAALIRQDTGKTIDVTPPSSANGEVQ